MKSGFGSEALRARAREEGQKGGQAAQAKYERAVKEGRLEEGGLPHRFTSGKESTKASAKLGAFAKWAKYYEGRTPILDKEVEELRKNLRTKEQRVLELQEPFEKVQEPFQKATKELKRLKLSQKRATSLVEQIKGAAATLLEKKTEDVVADSVGTLADQPVHVQAVGKRVAKEVLKTVESRNIDEDLEREE